MRLVSESDHHWAHSVLDTGPDQKVQGKTSGVGPPLPFSVLPFALRESTARVYLAFLSGEGLRLSVAAAYQVLR